MSQRTFYSQRFGMKLPLTLALAASSIVLTTGCANMATTAPAGNAFLEIGTMSGKIQGGNQPISGATVNLYAAGTTGYGKGSVLLATTTSGTGTGAFAFSQVGSKPASLGASYACPSPNSLLYLIASGGNTLNDGSSAFNTAAVMMAAIGKCSTAASTFTNINEITSVASVTALQQYINPGTSTPGSSTVGTSSDYTVAPQSASGVGIINAFATAANLATFSTGSANTGSTLTGTAATVNGTAVTVTTESAKLNTMGNILAACVNNASASNSSCTTVFTNAVPPAPALTSQPTATFSTAVDVLQAAYYMATNPTDGGTTALGNLFALQAGVGAPFQTALSAAPTDWTIGIGYKGASACTGTGSASTLILYPYLLSSDASGNIWFVSNNALGTLSEVSPTGTPLACTLGSTLSATEGLAIDTAGYVWVAGHTSANILRVDPNTLATTTWTEASNTPWALAADGSGNVFYTTSGKTVREFAGGATATAAAAGVVIGGTTGSTPNYMAIDRTGNIWVPETSTTGGLYEFYPDSSSAGVGGYSTFNTDSTNTFSYNVQGIPAIDNSGNIWFAESSSRNIMVKATPGTPGSAATGQLSTTLAGGLNSGRGVAIDGAGNVWVANGVANSSLQSVAVFDKNGNPLSATATTSPAGYQKPATVFISTLRGITIDPSGNIWMGTNATAGASLSEIVGAAVPVVAPLSLALKNNLVGAKP